MTNRDDEPFADKLNSIPKVVFSRTLDRAPWGTWNGARVVKDDAIEEVAELKRQPGKNIIVWGSIWLVQSFLDAGMIDEYRLVVCLWCWATDDHFLSIEIHR